MKWMDEVNEQLDRYKLRFNFQIKHEHVKILKSLQSVVAMKELELSDIAVSYTKLRAHET